jgi:hypothetical protein
LITKIFTLNLGIEEHHEKITTEYNEEQTIRAIRKQNQTTGQCKRKTNNDNPKAAAI